MLGKLAHLENADGMISPRAWIHFAHSLGPNGPERELLILCNQPEELFPILVYIWKH